jgi:alkanesulfonate monooxygenase SsuD/methylene tetrahydromethanopterin reductase-like flavin-dependent oxidoreductase (luciferase family)
MKLSPPKSPGRVDINIGFKSTRNFNSVSVNIGLTDEVRAEETADQAVERIYAYVEGKVVEKLESTLEEVERVYDGKPKRQRKG